MSRVDSYSQSHGHQGLMAIEAALTGSLKLVALLPKQMPEELPIHTLEQDSSPPLDDRSCPL